MILNLLRHMRPDFEVAADGGGMFGLPEQPPTLAPAAAPGTTPVADPASAGQPATPAPAASPDGLKAEPKTPETPAVTADPAKPDTPPDPTKTTPEPAKADAPPTPKTVDELEASLQDAKQRAAYYQSQHQRDKKELETLRKQYVRPVKPATEPEKKNEPAIDPEELRQKLRDDPLAFLEETKRVVAEAHEESVAKSLKAEQEKQDAELFAKEKDDTVAAYHRMIFATDDDGNLMVNKEGKAVLVVPEKVLLKAKEAVDGYGFDLAKAGGPTRYLQALMDHVNFLMSREADAVATTDKEAEMAAKVKQNKLGVQPPPIGVVSPGAKSPEQQRLDNLDKQRPRGASDLPA